MPLHILVGLNYGSWGDAYEGLNSNAQRMQGYKVFSTILNAQRRDVGDELLQEDQALIAEAEAAVARYSEPVKVVRVRSQHHALDLWEDICLDKPDIEQQPPILLLPDGYEFAEGQAEILAEMGKLYKLNELVSNPPPSFFPLGTVLEAPEKLHMVDRIAAQ